MGNSKSPETAAHVDSLAGLLALQEVPSDLPEERRRAIARGDDILDRLEEIRLGLLTGRISRDGLERLVSLLRDKRHGVADPELKTVLEEIELRAAVELAKLERSS